MPSWKAKKLGKRTQAKVLLEPCSRFANSIRPLSAQETRGVILPVPRAQKRSPEINVVLVASQEVFGQHAARDFPTMFGE
jgi:hypothetical protein